MLDLNQRRLSWRSASDQPRHRLISSARQISDTDPVRLRHRLCYDVHQCYELRVYASATSLRSATPSALVIQPNITCLTCSTVLAIMSKIKRTPPNSPLVSLNTQTQSEPDINSAVAMSGFVNTTRNKRLRNDNSPQGGLYYQISQDDVQEPSFSKTLAEQTVLMSKLMSDVAEIKCQNTAIQATNAAIKKSNEEIFQSISFLNTKFEDMKKEIEELKKSRDAQQRHIEHLDKKIIDLQLKSRSSGIEIRNVPYTDTEDRASLSKTVIKISEVLGTTISNTNIRDVYRLPGKPTNTNSPRPIVAEFAAVSTKQTIVAAVRSFNNGKAKDQKLNTSHIGLPGKTQPIFIAEQLPLSTRKLYHLAREFASKHAYRFCWVSNGNIFLRKLEGEKHILVSSDQSLQDLEAK